MRKKRLEACEMWIWRKIERIEWRQNKICSCARKSGWRKNNAGPDKDEEKKLAVPLAKKEPPAKGSSRREKKVRGRRRYQMIDNIMINGLYADTERKAEKRLEWRMLSLQWKLLGRTPRLIDRLIIMKALTVI